MRWVVIAMLVAAVGCGGEEAPAVNDAGATPPTLELHDFLGIRCDVNSSFVCPILRGQADQMVCANDRFGRTCNAYCTSTSICDAQTTCLPRLGSAPGDGLPGFCWRSCTADTDCDNALQCDAAAHVCRPRF